MSYQPYGNQQSFQPPNPPATNGKSVAGMVLGILSIVLPYVGFFLGIVAIIISSISLKEINTRQEQGRGMAIAGLVCGIVGTLIYAILFIVLIISFVLLNNFNNV